MAWVLLLLLAQGTAGFQSLSRMAITSSSRAFSVCNSFTQRRQRRDCVAVLSATSTRPPNQVSAQDDTNSTAFAVSPSFQQSIGSDSDSGMQAAIEDTASKPIMSASQTISNANLDASSSYTKQEASMPVTVVVNMNARGVTESTVNVARSVFGNECVYVTNSAVEADEAAAAMARCPPKILVPMGGDGTLTAVLQNQCRAIVASEMKEFSSSGSPSSSLTLDEAVRRLPIVAYIPLGTGNAVGSVVGCRVASKWSLRRRSSRSLYDVLQQIKSIADTDTTIINTVELPILEVTTESKDSVPSGTTANSTLCFFAGGTLVLDPVGTLQ
jgi:hypothetical protein